MAAAVRLSVVLPCRNQADHIGAVLDTYRVPLEGLGIAYELVVVPNACTDDTVAIVQGLASADPRLRVVLNPAGGWGRSVLMGLAAASGSALCYTNSARTRPADLVELYRKYEAEVPGLAKVRREQRGVPLREIGSFLYNLEGRLLFGIRARDVNGTPKIFSRDLYNRLALRSVDDLVDLELMAKAARLRVPVVELPVAGFVRHGGSSSTNWKSAWKMYSGALRLRFAL